MSLSVVIPAYNEEDRIGPTLKVVSSFLARKVKDYEIIVVNDGSTDKTVSFVKSLKIKHLFIVDLKKNVGKGGAIRKGFLKAKKDFVLFMDGDLATPIQEFGRLFPFTKDFDVVIASRNAKGAHLHVKQPFYRQILGKTFPFFVNFFLPIRVLDSQCGFKFFSKKAAKLIARKQTIMRWAFDAEQLLIAKKHGFKIKEVGVSWYDKEGSKVHTFKDGFRMGFDVLKIFFNNLRGLY